MRNFTKISLALLMFVLTAMNSIVSAQSFECRVENESYPSATTYEFDVKLYATGATTTWEYSTGVFNINMNPAFRNAGTITPTLLSGTSELVSAQVPTSIQYQATNNYVGIAAKTPPGAGAGTIINQNGARIIRVRLTNTVSFSTSAAPNLTFRWASPNSLVSAYVSGVNTPIANNILTAGQRNCKTPNYWNGTSWNKGLPLDTTDAVVFAGTAYTGSLAVRSLTIAPNGKYTIADTNSLKIITALANFGSCVLKSSDLGTGRLAEVPSTATVSGTGTYTVERFILGSSGRRYRYLSAPFATGPAISASWQQQIHITGNGTGGSICPSLTANSNGFDATISNSASMHTFNESTASVDLNAIAVNSGATVYNNAWTSIPSTSATLAAGTGYRVFVRGNRTQGCDLLNGTNPSALDVTLSATGTIKTGNHTFSVTYSAANGQGWNLLGNPYPSPINWDAAAWTKTNIDPSIWIFRPSTNSYANYNVTAGVGINGGSNLIESGSAFFVKTNAASPALTCTEAVKSTAPTTKLFKNNAKYLSLSFIKPGQLIDELALAMIPGVSAQQDEFDSEKMMNPSVNVYAMSDKFRNGIQSFPTINEQMSIPLGIGSVFTGKHQITIKGEKDFDQYDLLLVDHYLGVITLLNEKPVVEFEINADAASKGEDRFEIIFINKGYNDYLKNLASVYNSMNQLQVTPNPVQTTTKISCNTATVEGNVNFKVFNNIGQLVQQGTVLNANLQNGIEVDLSARSAGVYFIEVADVTGKLNTAKIVKN
jgi:hypothetical protein